MTYLALTTLRHGRRAGFATLLGVALGLAVLGGMATLGITALLTTYPLLHHALYTAGVAYLLWLAAEAWRERATADVSSDARHFRHGLVTNLLNPKAALFYIAVFPKFVDAGAPIAPQMMILTALYVLIASLVHVAIVLFSAQGSNLLQNAKRQRVTRRLFAVLLAIVALWMALQA